MMKHYIEPTQESGAALFTRDIPGEVVMLNLLRYREVADYTDFPELKPDSPVSGEEAYKKYMEHTLPFLQKNGGEVIFMGKGGQYFIGPEDGYWDFAMLVRQKSLKDFLAFASDPGYQAGLGHRTAALEDSRLLPLVEIKR